MRRKVRVVRRERHEEKNAAFVGYVLDFKASTDGSIHVSTHEAHAGRGCSLVTVKR